jgi:N-acetylglucosamine repressor
MTVRRVLELLQSRGPSTRAELTRLSGISAPTVSKAVGMLLESGLVEEGESPPASLGRPGTVLRMAREGTQVIAVVLDAGRCSVVSAGLDGALRADSELQFSPASSYAALLDQIAAAAKKLMKRPGVETLAVGLSIPGLINHRLKKAVFSPNLHVTDGHAPARDLKDRLGVDCVMQQETHALCLGARMFNGSQSLDDFVMLEISGGLGVGVVTGGRLMTGHSGLAGELGHVTVVPDGRHCGCGNRGCLETVATDSALALAVSERIGRAITIDELTQQIHAGELAAEAEIRAASEYLAIAIAAAINLFNPTTLFVHGRLFDAQEGLFEEVRELARRRALAPSIADCRILRAHWSKSQGAVAAAIYHLFSAWGPTLDE